MSDRATFSDYCRSDYENVSDKRNGFDETESAEVVDAYPSTSAIDHSQVSLIN